MHFVHGSDINYIFLCSTLYSVHIVLCFMHQQSLKKTTTHCKEIWIYVFPEKELRGLSPNFHIHVSVSDLYIPTFGTPVFLQQNRQTENI